MIVWNKPSWDIKIKSHANTCTPAHKPSAAQTLASCTLFAHVGTRSPWLSIFKLYSLPFENSWRRTSESVQRFLGKQRRDQSKFFLFLSLSLFFFGNEWKTKKKKRDRSLAASAEWRTLFSLLSPATAQRTLMGFSGFSDSSLVKV